MGFEYVVKMKFFKRSDLIVIVVILALGILGLLGYRYIVSDKPAKAEIYYYGDLVEVVELKQGVDRTMSLKEAPGVVIKQEGDGCIFFESSDCPDKICVLTGKLSMIGESAACLPNGVLIKIVPQGERGSDQADIIVG